MPQFRQTHWSVKWQTIVINYLWVDAKMKTYRRARFTSILIILGVLWKEKKFWGKGGSAKCETNKIN